MGPPLPPETEWYNRSDVEEEICDGIDGGDWYSGISDTPQFCESCGQILKFRLTAYGVEYTLEGFAAASIGPETIANSAAVYELREMFEAGAWSEDRDLRRELRKTAQATLRSIRQIAPSSPAPMQPLLLGSGGGA